MIFKAEDLGKIKGYLLGVADDVLEHIEDGMSEEAINAISSEYKYIRGLVHHLDDYMEIDYLNPNFIVKGLNSLDGDKITLEVFFSYIPVLFPYFPVIEECFKSGFPNYHQLQFLMGCLEGLYIGNAISHDTYATCLAECQNYEYVFFDEDNIFIV